MAVRCANLVFINMDSVRRQNLGVEEVDVLDVRYDWHAIDGT